MKFLAVTLLAFIATACAGPVSVNDNNVGDIVSVKVNADLELSNEVNMNIFNMIVALLNQQHQIIPINGEAAQPNFKITPEMIENVKKLLSEQ